MQKNTLDESINVRVTKREKDMIEKLAKSEGVRVSDYVRMVILVDIFFHGSWKGFKYVVQNMKYNLAKKLEKKIAYVGLEHHTKDEDVQKLINEGL